MKNFSRSTLFFSMIFILCLGLLIQSFPLKIASAAGSSDTTENSGGFIVQADKVEGSMNPVAMAAGEVVMGEGKIYGLTITKKLEKSKPGVLIIKIKSEGPIPVKDLKGKLMGLPQFSSPCLPSQVGWLCLNDVKMKLSEQTVGSISLPNATIETCFEGQCQAVDPNINGKSLKTDNEKSPQTTTIPEMTKQIDQLTHLLDRSNDLQGVINKGADTLQNLMKKAEDSLGLADQLEPLTKQIGDGFQQLQENLDKWLPLLSDSDRLLSQITDTISQGDGEQLSKSLAARLQKIKDQTKDLQDEVTALKDNQQINTEKLNGLKKGVDHLKDAITKNKSEYSGDQLKRLLQNLGVNSSVEKIATTTPISLPETAPTAPSTTENTSGTGSTTSNSGNSGENPSAQLEKQLTDTIENGKRLASSLKGTLANANSKMDEMEQLSGNLVDVNLFLVKILNEEKAEQYQADLDDVKGYIDTIAGPVQELKDTISKAEALQTQLGQSSNDLQDLKDALNQVGITETRLKDDLMNKLNSLPLLSKILSFIEQLDDIIKEMDAWDI